MYAQVTLYKTGFDPQNIYVGESESGRKTALDNLPAAQKYELAPAPYNPAFPFRIALNAYKVDRVFDYARFAFMETPTGVPLQERHYFIRNASFINDNTCELIVTEDLIGDEFWRMNFERLIPSVATYKASTFNTKKDYTPVSLPNTYTPDVLYNSTLNLDADRKLGAIIVTLSVNGTALQGEKYRLSREGGVTYPIETILLPFALNTTNQTVESFDENIVFNYNGNYIRGIEEYNNLARNVDLPDGVTFLCAGITFDLQPYFNISVIPPSEGMVLTTYNLTPTTNQFATFQKNKFHATDAKEYIFLNNHEMNFRIIDISGAALPNGLLEKTPYTRYTLTFGAQSAIIDPVNFKANANYNIYWRKSFLPPYTLSIAFGSNFGQPTNYTPTPIFEFNPNVEIYEYSDEFINWYRQNKNSVFTGLEVQQETAQNNQALQQNAQLLNTAIKSGAETVGGIAAGAATGSLVAAGGAAIRGSIDLISNMATTGISQATDQEILANNQRMERTLLNLRMADIQNAPASVSMKAAIPSMWTSYQFFRIIYEKNVYLDVAENYHKAYGYERALAVSQIRQHADFDYIKVADCAFTTTPPVNVTDFLAISDTLAAGVRVWYNLDNYKNFDTENAEL